MKSVEWEPSCSRTDGQPDRLEEAFSNFANVPNSFTFYPHSVFMFYVRISAPKTVISLYKGNESFL